MVDAFLSANFGQTYGFSFMLYVFLAGRLRKIGVVVKWRGADMVQQLFGVSNRLGTAKTFQTGAEQNCLEHSDRDFIFSAKVWRMAALCGSHTSWPLSI